MSERDIVASLDDDNIDPVCWQCGATDTYELTHEDTSGREQSITVCAVCGSDE